MSRAVSGMLCLCLIFAAAAGARGQVREESRVTHITEPAPDTTVPQGSALYVRGEVHVPGWVRLVTLLVDNRPVASRRWSPYVFRWDTSRAKRGRHVLRLKVEQFEGGELICAGVRVNVGPRAWSLPPAPPGEELRDADWQRLVDLADYWEADLRSRHDREGLVDDVSNQPAVGENPLSGTADPRAPLLTGSYAGACAYRFATLRDPDARARGTQAYEALHMLSAATGMSGLLGQWFRRTSTRQPDEGQPGLVRWRQNGVWRWLGDAGPTDYAGVLFGHALYYDFVAGEEEEQRVVQDVTSIANRILKDGLVITNVDGLSVPRGNLSPDRLGHPVNAVLALGFFKIAHHVTGEKKFGDQYQEMIRTHAYHRKGVKPADAEPDEWTAYHDYAAMLMYCCLLEYEKDEEIRGWYRRGMEAIYQSSAKQAADKPSAGRPLFSVIYKRFYPESEVEKQGIEWLLDSRSPLGDSELLLANWMGRYYQIVR